MCKSLHSVFVYILHTTPTFSELGLYVSHGATSHMLHAELICTILDIQNILSSIQFNFIHIALVHSSSNFTGKVK